VTFDGGERKPGDLLIGDRHGAFNLIGQSTEPGAEDDADIRLNPGAFPYHIGSTLHPVEQRRCGRHCGSKV
jgi:hypothetical protein